MNITSIVSNRGALFLVFNPRLDGHCFISSPISIILSSLCSIY